MVHRSFSPRLGEGICSKKLYWKLSRTLHEGNPDQKLPGRSRRAVLRRPHESWQEGQDQEQRPGSRPSCTATTSCRISFYVDMHVCCFVLNSVRGSRMQFRGVDESSFETYMHCKRAGVSSTENKATSRTLVGPLLGECPPATRISGSM